MYLVDRIMFNLVLGYCLEISPMILALDLIRMPNIEHGLISRMEFRQMDHSDIGKLISKKCAKVAIPLFNMHIVLGDQQP